MSSPTETFVTNVVQSSPAQLSAALGGGPCSTPVWERSMWGSPQKMNPCDMEAGGDEEGRWKIIQCNALSHYPQERQRIWAAGRWKWNRKAKDATARRRTWRKCTNAGSVASKRNRRVSEWEKAGRLQLISLMDPCWNVAQWRQSAQRKELPDAQR